MNQTTRNWVGRIVTDYKPPPHALEPDSWIQLAPRLIRGTGGRTTYPTSTRKRAVAELPKNWLFLPAKMSA